jgi:hypothetical protein
LVLRGGARGGQQWVLPRARGRLKLFSCDVAGSAHAERPESSETGRQFARARFYSRRSVGFCKAPWRRQEHSGQIGPQHVGPNEGHLTNACENHTPRCGFDKHICTRIGRFATNSSRPGFSGRPPARAVPPNRLRQRQGDVRRRQRRRAHCDSPPLRGGCSVGQHAVRTD